MKFKDLPRPGEQLDGGIFAGLTTPINEHQQFILYRLGRLGTYSGMMSADFAFLIGRQPGRGARQHAAYIRGLLLDLEKRGLIVRADGRKPILWRLK